MFDVKAVRRHFPHTAKTAYFNAASTGPFPTPAYGIQDECYQIARMAEVGSQAELFTALDNIRRNGARIFGCNKSAVGFGFNTTFGINLAAFGLPLKRGDEVLLCDVEFPANVYPWLELRNRGIKVTFLKSVDGFISIDRFRHAIGKKTRVVSISHVQYFNGYKADMDTIAAICREHDIFLVLDAIQSAGCEPISVDKWNVAIASAGAQKWLLSPQGTGLFHISEETRRRLIPPWRSWLSIDWKCDWTNLRDFHRKYDSSARQFELGTYPVAHVLALDWALEFITGLKIRAIQKHNHALLDTLIDYLRTEPFYTITSSLENKHRSSILSFTTETGNIAAVYRRLLANKVIPALREGSIRISAHLYNDRADVERLIAGLQQAASVSRRNK